MVFDPTLQQFFEDQFDTLRRRLNETQILLAEHNEIDAIEIVEDVRDKYEKMVNFHDECK